MNIKEQLAEVREVIGVEDAEVRSEKVGRLLKEFELAYNSREDDVSAVTAESIKRKNRIRELESESEKQKDKIAEYESDNSLQTITKERDDLKVKVEDYDKIRRDTFINEFKKVQTHKDFDLIKDKLILPDESNGEIDFKEASNDDVFKNQGVIQDAKGYGLFTETTKTQTSNVDVKGVDKSIPGLFDKMGKR